MSLGFVPYHNNILVLGAYDNSIDSHTAPSFALDPPLFDRPNTIFW